MVSSSPEKIIIVDNGSQYTLLIARRLREVGVFCEIVAWKAVINDWIFRDDPTVRGVILSGSPACIRHDSSPHLVAEFFTEWCKLPILGICYGMQLMAHALGGKVVDGTPEFGFAELEVSENNLFYSNSTRSETIWMSHADNVLEMPPGFECWASTKDCKIAMMACPARHLYAVQHHPEVTETERGGPLLEMFAKKICGCAGSWLPDRIRHEIREKINSIAGHLPNEDVLLALSGGVDSSVAACLLFEALGDRLKCVLIDNGLMRLNEAAEVQDAFATFNSRLSLRVVDASGIFFERLRGITDPEEKRHAIGKTFIEEFEKLVKTDPTYKNVTFLAQGTIYPDVIESAGVGTCTALIKSHHNVGGLPKQMTLKLLEPLRCLFKDEVRRLGLYLGLPASFIWRHPFPGPGLGVRVLGEVTPARVDKLRQADHIFTDLLKKRDLYNEVSQAFAVLLPCHSVAVKGDARSYEEVIVLRAVKTLDFMTARVGEELPLTFLQEACRSICNQVEGVSRVCYDLTEKPPATIEWE